MAPSLFSFFFSNSARVPLHSLEAFEGILHPSMELFTDQAHLSSTSRNNTGISSLIAEIKPAMVLKWGWVFSRQQRSISRLEIIPRA